MPRAKKRSLDGATHSGDGVPTKLAKTVKHLTEDNYSTLKEKLQKLDIACDEKTFEEIKNEFSNVYNTKKYQTNTFSAFDKSLFVFLYNIVFLKCISHQRVYKYICDALGYDKSNAPFVKANIVAKWQKLYRCSAVQEKFAMFKNTENKYEILRCEDAITRTVDKLKTALTQLNITFFNEVWEEIEKVFKDYHKEANYYGSSNDNQVSPLDKSLFLFLYDIVLLTRKKHKEAYSLTCKELGCTSNAPFAERNACYMKLKNFALPFKVRPINATNKCEPSWEILLNIDKLPPASTTNALPHSNTQSPQECQELSEKDGDSLSSILDDDSLSVLDPPSSSHQEEQGATKNTESFTGNSLATINTRAGGASVNKMGEGGNQYTAEQGLSQDDNPELPELSFDDVGNYFANNQSTHGASVGWANNMGEGTQSNTEFDDDSNNGPSTQLYSVDQLPTQQSNHKSFTRS